jgi:uncharacterized protein (TIGR02246 family)
MNQDLRGLENDEAGVRALMQRLYEAWGEGDADAFAALFTEDADYVTFDGSLSKGRQAIADIHRPLFEGFMKGSRLTGQTTAVRFLAPDVALVHSKGAVLRKNQRRPSRRALSVQTNVVVRQGDRWLLTAFQSTRYRPWTKTLLGRLLLLLASRPKRV